MEFRCAGAGSEIELFRTLKTTLICTASYGFCLVSVVYKK